MTGRGWSGEDLEAVALAINIRTGKVLDWKARRRCSASRCGRSKTPVLHGLDEFATYTSWVFGHRLRESGLLGLMGSIGDCFDNSVAESFFATLQTELLDRSTWPTR
ncbi:hypothetical protein GCM10027020_12640 [Nocardioides salsibiostraticola]